MRILKTNCEKNQLYEQQGSKIILGWWVLEKKRN
jgi:hypothetical protein